MTGYAQRPDAASLQELRLRAGLTRRAIAIRAGVAEGTVRRAELGYLPTPESQIKLAAALSEVVGRPIDQLELWPLVELERNGDGS